MKTSFCNYQSFFIYQLMHKNFTLKEVLKLFQTVPQDIHQPEPDNICGHTTELTITIYFNP